MGCGRLGKKLCGWSGGAGGGVSGRGCGRGTGAQGGGWILRGSSCRGSDAGVFLVKVRGVWTVFGAQTSL